MSKRSIIVLEEMSASVRCRHRDMIINTVIQRLSNRRWQGNGIFN
jgi:hypothetical protein